jgi:biopolymer transport protein ExbB
MGAMFGFFDMQNAMQEVSEREVSKLYRKLEYLSFIATTSPMLGLLGTVTGMISSFNEIRKAEGAANPSDLAGGISMALVTTCMGLIVAIPTMFFVAFFRKRIDGFVAESETVVEKLMGHFRSGAK